ncbi:MAG: hypothetical protein AAGK21_08860 [Bacteroidota bacterium]
MQTRVNLLALLVLMAVAGACASVRALEERPDDFSVEARWRTGSLPPPYHHSEHITISPAGDGVLRGETAYGDGPSETWTFQLGEDDLDRLYDDLREAGLFRSWREDTNPPVGGGSWWADVTAGGDTTEIPSFPRGGWGDKQRVEDVLRSAVPSATWSAHASWLSDALSTLSEPD